MMRLSFRVIAPSLALCWLAALVAPSTSRAESARFGGTHAAAPSPVARGGGSVGIGPNLQPPSILNPSVLNPGAVGGTGGGTGYGRGSHGIPGRYPRGVGGGIYLVPGYDYGYDTTTNGSATAGVPIWAQVPPTPAPAPAPAADPATIAAAVAAAVASQKQADARASGGPGATRMASAVPAKSTTLYRCPGGAGQPPQFRDTPCKGTKATENIYTPGQ